MKNPRRIKFVYDDYARFEECNGESRPLDEEEYRENAYRACPLHPRAGTKVIDYGGEGRPQVQGCAVCGNTKYEDIPYEEYLAYYGNPDRHVYLCAICEEQCPHCQQWHHANSVANIDFMDDSPEYVSLRTNHWYQEDEATKLPGYVGDVARELIEEE